MKPIRVLIADDEFLARRRLEDLLAQEPDVEIVAAVEDGCAAVNEIESGTPDVVFLDVQMPGYTGTQVVEEVGPERMPITIFVTAYDTYLLRAFEVAALDYLLKPFDDERFEQAFDRARKMLKMREAGQLADRLRAFLDTGEGSEVDLGSGERWLERIAVEARGQVVVVPVERISHITSSGAYAELHAGGKVHLIREKMQTLEDRLDPSRFFRVHRSSIVRLEMVEAILNRGGGDYFVRLSDGTRLSLSRSRRPELEKRLGIAGLRTEPE